MALMSPDVIGKKQGILQPLEPSVRIQERGPARPCDFIGVISSRWKETCVCSMQFLCQLSEGGFVLSVSRTEFQSCINSGVDMLSRRRF